MARGSCAFVTFDFTGHGLSYHSPDGYKYGTLIGYVSDLLLVVDTLKIPRFIAVGHSMGGGVMLIFAATFPHRYVSQFGPEILS
jgi:pimeloyl-ACP methyl ester carboxylesterase